MAYTSHCGTASGVKDFQTIIHQEVIASAANDLVRFLVQLAIQDGAGGGLVDAIDAIYTIHWRCDVKRQRLGFKSTGGIHDPG